MVKTPNWAVEMLLKTVEERKARELEFKILINVICPYQCPDKCEDECMECFKYWQNSFSNRMIEC